MWLCDTYGALQTHLGADGYTNGLDPELTDWQQAHHGANYPKMQRVKSAYDPDAPTPTLS
ncbi:BBE domain-containing protein [Streptomyces sp. NPDC001691]|uniref:BBE domain-containing protein n=1 Tax=unclassified Streptomyces TaxID=2593676 RepID=UPI001CB8A64A|nr:BBE domain-containing protein [Streptomyces sp. SDr-06]